MSTFDVTTLLNLHTRQTVVVRRNGWVESKKYGEIVGSVREDKNAAGKTLWRAYAGDISSWQWKREEAVQRVVELHNMQEKARGYDLLSRRPVNNG